MANNNAGSKWHKWDLHVHTPESLVHHYPGEKEAAWQAFLDDLEALPPEFKVIGINDYIFVDGYERVRAEKMAGRLKNIDLFLPVIELRLDKFGGILERNADGDLGDSAWSRINLHVIFDAVSPDLLKQQFIPAITQHYNLIAGSAGAGFWGGILNRETLTDLGKKIIATLPEGQSATAISPIKVGFNNLNISLDRLQLALKNPHLRDRHLIAIGKSEWESLRWSNHTIAEKRTVINSANFVFTAAANPEAYAKARKALKDAGVNDHLLDCSDAHRLSTSKEKDRVGNCFTCIKADTTFEGLLQASQEFEDRIFVGDYPPKLRLIEQNKTKYIQSITVSRTAEAVAADAEEWFAINQELSADLVAIIGNKGSGKSALSDIIALAGNTKHHQGFSFLLNSRFRNPKSKYAQNFTATLTWLDGQKTIAELDKDPDASSVERVKYLPQSYLEDLCNELGDGGSLTFDAELRKIIYSHVPEADRLGQASMDDLLQFKVSEIDSSRISSQQELKKVNEALVLALHKATPEFRDALVKQLAAKEAERLALEAAKPALVDDPNASPEAQSESKAVADHIADLERQIAEIDGERQKLKELGGKHSKQQAIAAKISMSLSNQRKLHEKFLSELRESLDSLGIELPMGSLIQLFVNTEPVDKIALASQVAIGEATKKLESDEPGSLTRRRQDLVELISVERGKLGERERQFVLYKEQLAHWEKLLADLIGSADRPTSLLGLSAQLLALDEIPSQIEELKAKRLGLAKEIYKHIEKMVSEYERLYRPVQSFVNSEEQKLMNLPLAFHVQVEQVGFQDGFLNRINRQARGSFAGLEESNQVVRGMIGTADFTNVDGALAFAEEIEDRLNFDRRDERNVKATYFPDQLRRGVQPQDVLDYIFGFEYLRPRYSLTYSGQEIGQLSPGERGLLLLVFYLLVDKDDIPIVIDQPEENLDNQTIYKVLVKCIKKAKDRRQVIMVTHNPNLAVVCDAEQIIYASCDKQQKRFFYEAGAMENPAVASRVVQILEGTAPAFRNRQLKYGINTDFSKTAEV
ncbi:TrlF family AAA-like ATPase [Herbaspirillum huttiense]|uniref:TrlF family AAA-like ATPase n=1 Tax=Herbaspirillum huttiense TaxID=863372 RepID=UPI002176C9E5|nr:AAA family ATPase [Herbaspirillum huttiense]UWE17602.1 ABC transporter [Herbaspirillum huttiense]